MINESRLEELIENLVWAYETYLHYSENHIWNEADSFDKYIQARRILKEYVLSGGDRA